MCQHTRTGPFAAVRTVGLDPDIRYDQRRSGFEEAARRQLEAGNTVSLAAPVLVDLAEALVDLVSSADWALFGKNGADSTALAVMVARAATGRRLVVKVDDGYHGSAPWTQSAGNPGTTADDQALVRSVPWNDAEAIARVIDDVRTGFRIDLAGSNVAYGFEPDLVCFGKALGNGHPIAALTGTDAMRVSGVPGMPYYRIVGDDGGRVHAAWVAADRRAEPPDTAGPGPVALPPMVNFGVTMFPTDKAINPMVLAQEAEARGFESIWFPEHSHIPTSRVTPWGGNPKAPPLPEEYWRTYDQFVALGMAAAVTTTIKVGTGITLVAQRDPIWLAKEVATVDALSGGRLLFGIGYGWNKEELAHHGVRYTDRRAVLREKILAMKEIWTKDEAAFSGEHVEFSSSWSWPKPAQQPHPPIILGGSAGPRTMADIVEFCDGFMPISGRYDIGEQITKIRQMAEDAGRSPATIEFGQFGTPAKPEIIDQMVEAGLSRILFSLPPAGDDKVLPLLDRYAEVAGQYG